MAGDPLTLAELQSRFNAMYGEKDQARGAEGTFLWFCEEVGELAAALRVGERENLAAEFADVLAWLVTLANVAHVDLTSAIRQKYGQGCPGCGSVPCRCDRKEKP
jgi:NTP pyrophosphatase (non-canonical NTP hydrolase)